MGMWQETRDETKRFRVAASVRLEKCIVQTTGLQRSLQRLQQGTAEATQLWLEDHVWLTVQLCFCCWRGDAHRGRGARSHPVDRLSRMVRDWHEFSQETQLLQFGFLAFRIALNTTSESSCKNLASSHSADQTSFHSKRFGLCNHRRQSNTLDRISARWQQEADIGFLQVCLLGWRRCIVEEAVLRFGMHLEEQMSNMQSTDIDVLHAGIEQVEQLARKAAKRAEAADEVADRLMQSSYTHGPVGNRGTKGVSPRNIPQNSERCGPHNANQPSNGQVHDVTPVASPQVRRCATSPERRPAPAVLMASPHTIVRPGVEGSPTNVLAGIASVAKGGAYAQLESASSRTTLSGGTGIVRSPSPSRPTQYYVSPVAQTESVGPGPGFKGFQGTTPVQATLQNPVQAVPTVPAIVQAAVSASMCGPSPSNIVVKPPLPVVSTGPRGWGQMQQGAPYGRATLPSQAHALAPAWVAAVPPRHI